ncbi:hypothetical protein [Nocardia donostiensis]|nr:hypothetical protein [Nocardia donostiensis]
MGNPLLAIAAASSGAVSVVILGLGGGIVSLAAWAYWAVRLALTCRQ